MTTLYRWLLGALMVAVAPLAQAEVLPSELPFGVGEKLSYRIFWGPVLIGNATLEVVGIESIDEHSCFRIKAHAETVGIGRLIYRLDSTTESWVDTKGLFSRRFVQNRREGGNFSSRVTRFDYDRNEAITRNLESGKDRTNVITGPVHDVVTSLYYMRSRPLAVDRAEQCIINASGENWTVTFRPDQRHDMSLRPVGNVSALRIEPDPTLKVVAANKGRMWFWITDDSRHLPLVLNSPTSIGTAKMVLYKVEQRPVVQAVALAAPPPEAVATVP